MHTWKTKFQPGDKVLWSGEIATIIHIEIFYPSGVDMEHWKKVLPKIGENKYQHTSYMIELTNGEYHTITEDGLILTGGKK